MVRIHLSAVTVLMAAFFSGTFLSQAQTALSLPGCETAPEVRNILDGKLSYTVLNKMKIPEHLAYERQALEDLIAKYPRELDPYESLASLLRGYAPDEYPALRDQWIKKAKDNPGDPLALLLAGEALIGKDTPEAIRLLESARTQAPGFPWPALQLAEVYSNGKRADKDKLTVNLEAFFAACPASTNSTAQWLLAKDQPLQPKVAVALRARLEKETDPKRLKDYGTLWGLEFRTRSPNEHDALRAQVAEDLKRLETLNPKGDAEWQAFLIHGYKQSGVSKETITALEDRLIREYPHSYQAYSIVHDRWNTDHKQPEDDTDVVAWAAYRKQFEEALKGWILDLPDDTYMRVDAPLYAIDHDDTIAEKEGVASLDAYVQYASDFQEINFRAWCYQHAAQLLIKRGWQPTRALDLVKQARTLNENERARDQENDNLSDDDLKRRKERQIQQDQATYGRMLKAARQAGLPEEALKLRAAIEAPLPEPKYQSGYWLNRARFEAIQNHTQDALAYYQLALQTRTEAPKINHGELTDDLTDEARALWKAQGGSEAAWAVWSKQPSGGTAQPADGSWEKATKAIPEFELTDLSGRNWQLKELKGKTVLVALWATWCGPCLLELPHLEKFYEKEKNRSDLVVLTFDIDQDLGLVAPFVKKKGYTFPVLPAYSTVASLLGGTQIPQIWLVDPQGTWQWKQIGYDAGSDADFEKGMLAQMELLKAGQ